MSRIDLLQIAEEIYNNFGQQGFDVSLDEGKDDYVITILDSESTKAWQVQVTSA